MSSTPKKTKIAVKHYKAIACLECGLHFKPRRVDQKYCRSKCRELYNNRRGWTRVLALKNMLLFEVEG